MGSEYAKYAVSKRAKEVMEDPEKAYRYARNVIKGRWYQAELTIMKDPESAYVYARDVIRGRWYQAEQFIMNDPEWAHYYVLHVIEGRWPNYGAECKHLRTRSWRSWYIRRIKYD